MRNHGAGRVCGYGRNCFFRAADGEQRAGCGDRAGGYAGERAGQFVLGSEYGRDELSRETRGGQRRPLHTHFFSGLCQYVNRNPENLRALVRQEP